MIEEIKKIAEDFARQLLKAYEEYDNKMLDADGDEAERLRAELSEREDELYHRFEEQLESLGLECDLYVDGDSWNYFNAPGLPRAYNFYRCYLTISGIYDVKNLKHYTIYITYHELQYPYKTEYSNPDVDVEEGPLIDSKYTPFTARLCEEIPWLYIRPEWSASIHKFIEDLARAELEGRLNEAIKKVENKLKLGMWVYDYQHFYSALQRTKAAFNIA